MIAIDRYKKSLSCIMAVFTMMSLRMNLLKMDYKGNPLKRYLDALSGFSLDQLILFAGMICLFYYMLKENSRGIDLKIRQSSEKIAAVQVYWIFLQYA